MQLFSDTEVGLTDGYFVSLVENFEEIADDRLALFHRGCDAAGDKWVTDVDSDQELQVSSLLVAIRIHEAQHLEHPSGETKNDEWEVK